jgi:hypothetical protein
MINPFLTSHSSNTYCRIRVTGDERVGRKTYPKLNKEFTGALKDALVLAS